MSRRLFALLMIATAARMSDAGTPPPEIRKCRQCIVVLSKDWESTSGGLRAFERGRSNAPWKQRDREIPVVLGKNGLGRGRGLVHLELSGAPAKKEGDNKAPAGIFRLNSAFGYAPAQSASWLRLPYLALSPQIEGVDDPRSRYYNRLVDRSKVGDIDWTTSERMLRGDIRYKWGVVVEHNSKAVPGAGSCIFLHVWMNSSQLTSGCTAMSEPNLVKLLGWLDPAASPILVQMPRDAYRSPQSQYNLPAFP